MVGTWSGSFTNVTFQCPGTYQAENGVRCFLDMRTTPGVVVVDAPPEPEEHTSFIVSWDNPGRFNLSFAGGNFENPVAGEREIVSSPSISFRHGTVGLTFFNGTWEMFDWSLFNVSFTSPAFVGWRGRSTNGLCDLLPGAHGVIEVDRVAQGQHEVRLTPGLIVVGQTRVAALAIATGLAANNTPLMRVDDVGLATSDQIAVTTGVQNMGGVFLTNDLVSPGTNFHSITVEQFP